MIVEERKWLTATRAISKSRGLVSAKIFRYIRGSSYPLPLFTSAVSAGFPSPGDDTIDDELDLNDLLIRHPSSTFFLKVTGSSMVDVGIQDQDILIIDRSLAPTHGRVVVASVNGDLTVKRLHFEGKRVQLISENPQYPCIEVTDEMEFQVWGVVTNVIHKVR